MLLILVRIIKVIDYLFSVVVLLVYTSSVYNNSFQSKANRNEREIEKYNPCHMRKQGMFL